MEAVKNIASVVGLILSCITLITIFTNGGKKMLGSIFGKYNKERDEDIQELKDLIVGLSKELKDHVETEKETKAKLMDNDEIVLEFTRQQCRNIIKDMFYKYYNSKILPVYERKTLDYVEYIYIEKLDGNSYASELIEEMKMWKVDHMAVRVGEE